MRVATVFAGVPNPYEAGGMLMHWASINALLRAGHDVTFVSMPWDQPPRDDRIAALRELGADVVVLPRPAGTADGTGRWRARFRYGRSLLWPGDHALFPALASESELARKITELAPDALLADGVSAVTAAHRVPVPKLAFIGDPPGFSRRERLRWDPVQTTGRNRDALLHQLGTRTFALRADRRLLAMLGGYDSVGIFGAHRAEWARRHGIRAWYVRSPIMDAVGPSWKERRRELGPNPKPRMLLIGHLRGIATISGLYVFVEEILPALTTALGPERFDVEIVGAHDPPTSLRPALDAHPAVHLRGHVEPPDEEFLRADVVLVPTPIETGPRVRILSAFSYGCCVVAHEANRLGIPQLVHDENVLLADTAGLARETLRALADPELRERLGRRGRELYEAEFTPEKAGATIVQELERLATRS
ncbi:MAG TPA: glycosyltransferase [Gaiellaceae bacterium]|jgi:glycosyltransferase involved in cell wall biosynthesis|nr:glycosyltransferase [Gaiellaceae bacterium]